jgi:hypothetical protein
VDAVRRWRGRRIKGFFGTTLVAHGLSSSGRPQWAQSFGSLAAAQTLAATPLESEA